FFMRLKGLGQYRCRVDEFPACYTERAGFCPAVFVAVP
ncbi:MAG: hypothetical protein ACI83B_003295, partial [Sediminicola sp.]